MVEIKHKTIASQEHHSYNLVLVIYGGNPEHLFMLTLKREINIPLANREWDQGSGSTDIYCDITRTNSIVLGWLFVST